MRCSNSIRPLRTSSLPKRSASISRTASCAAESDGAALNYDYAQGIHGRDGGDGREIGLRAEVDAAALCLDAAVEGRERVIGGRSGTGVRVRAACRVQTYGADGKLLHARTAR